MFDPYYILDLPSAAGLAEARRAHQKLKSLYAFGTAATGALLSDEERQTYLERLDQALAAICVEISPVAATAALQNSAPEAGTEKPDPATSPGAFLLWTRLNLGMTLKELAEETKIGVSRIKAIEQEDEKSFLAPVYLRGFVHNIARALKLQNPHQIADLYLSKFRKADNDM